MRRLIFFFLPILIILGVMAAPLGKVQASGSVSGADMIALINGWRAGYFSNSLIEVSSLDACAQATADEMNAIGAWDHLANLGYASASSRCADYGFGGGSTIFVTENWATDSSMTIDLLASYWSDAAHMLPATSQQYCYVGVGISGDYYVLQAGAISGDTSCSSDSVSTSYSSSSSSDDSSDTTGDTSSDTSNYVQPIITSTPDLDGNYYHVVAYGQALDSIAQYYGVSIAQIKTLNSLTSDTIYVGEKLLISYKPTPTITLTRTATSLMPTRTQTSTPSPRTATPLPSPTPTVNAKGSSGIKIDRQWLGFGLLNISAIGLGVVVFFLFLRPLRQKRKGLPEATQPEKVEEKIVEEPAVKPKKSRKTAGADEAQPAVQDKSAPNKAKPAAPETRKDVGTDGLRSERRKPAADKAKPATPESGKGVGPKGKRPEAQPAAPEKPTAAPDKPVKKTTKKAAAPTDEEQPKKSVKKTK